jgi:hypothetical protein
MLERYSEEDEDWMLLPPEEVGEDVDSLDEDDDEETSETADQS